MPAGANAGPWQPLTSFTGLSGGELEAFPYERIASGTTRCCGGVHQANSTTASFQSLS
jgi:hypothetical protein